MYPIKIKNPHKYYPVRVYLGFIAVAEGLELFNILTP